MRCELLAVRHIALHLIAAARMQSMPRLDEIHRCAHERIDCGRSEARKWQSAIMVGTPRCPESFRGSAQRADPTNHSFPWRMRKIVGRERKFLAHLSVEM